MQPFIQATEDVTSLRAKVKREGFAMLKSRATPEGCAHIKSFIDQYPAKDAEINYGGTEKRIWGSHTMDPALQSFADLSDQVMRTVFHAQAKVKTVLSYSNYPIPQEDILITGRWHLDSLRHQYKLFCFLARTDERTGPLEVVPGTHRTAFKLWPLVTGQYISRTDLGTGKRRYQKLDERWVDTQCRAAGGSVPFLCEAGTMILVDTSAIHRARPCLEGHRYALCAYYDHF
jgi:ectoine hydroxylase-related dioxygenase (phytanoyl-CoA dioxygenase family)